jgi:hypothetical protein
MSVQIEIQQDRTVEEGPLYRVATSVVYNSGIGRNIFVFNTETQVFEHVATPWDMENVPNSRDEALTDASAFYRLPEVTRDFDVVATAIEYALYTRSRVEQLARDYGLTDDLFVGSGTHTYTGI